MERQDEKPIRDPMPDREIDWDVFDSDGRPEIQAVDMSALFDDDDEAAAFVLAAATGRGIFPDFIVKECRDAIREIVKSWPKNDSDLDDSQEE